MANNTVKFTHKEAVTLERASFTVTDFSVTDGQNNDGYVHKGLVVPPPPKEGLELTFNLGRKGSREVANWFTNKVLSGRNTYNRNPGSLNFAIEGTLKLTFQNTEGQITYTFSNIILAQGSSGTTNDWWFGGANCTFMADNTVSCKDDNNRFTVYFRRGGNDDNEVSVNYPD